MNRQVSSSSSSSFFVKHLATFNADRNLTAEDGMKKLKILETTHGITVMDCEIIIDRKYLTILDRITRQEIEVIPLKLIDEPTSVMSEDNYDEFNNILLFIANYNMKNSEMHIFHCVNKDSTEIVDEILAIKEGRKQQRNSYSSNASTVTSSILAPPQIPPEDPHHHHHHHHNQSHQHHQHHDSTAKDANNNISKPLSYTPLSESIDEDVQVLNHCFDDIERFVTRLQNAKQQQDNKHHLASNALASSKKKNKPPKKSKKKDSLNETQAQSPILSATTDPLTEILEEKHYMDILQKFKLSLILLAKLKHHIHDPNAPELIHFLFTPLQLITASLESTTNGTSICKTIWSPLLTKEAKDLLINCLTSKEYDLWQLLGDAWTISENEITTNIQYEPYKPVFFDGWSPLLEFNYQNLNKKLQQQQLANELKQQLQQNQRQLALKKQKQQISEDDEADDEQTEEQQSNDSVEMKKWAYNLYLNGAKVFEVVNDRKANNDKELSVKTGDLIEVLDDRRNWWRIRNMFGQIGHAPHTILQPYELPTNSNNLNNNNKYQIQNRSEQDKLGYF